ncbi:MAG: crotonase [Gammaproteobacteria bacterium]|nr:crotonase [Gammaproteobacteria bacterium]NIR82553.1 crotonase [Gammaproteobacteria bacterium]NIR88600.1 crotonase [Gammaproteobacteria bacterium]NIU03694.1 crotonase [Gammaproteobacteria bacterium]NIV51029.1 crotonase [Gammaproteobacteria bacterium]
MPEDTQLRHWRLREDATGIAWLHFDQAEASTNTLGRETLGELDDVLARLAEATPRGLVILSDKPSGFIAGADVRAFRELRNRHEALQAIRQGQSVLDRLAALRVPTVALIHGHCLGGGLELALACRYRVAEHDASLALPEVRLGIHPGFGGTWRLPRVIGAPRALDLMLSGRSVRGRQARRLGLVDHAVPERQLQRAAHSLALEPPRRQRPAAAARAAGSAALRPLLAWYLKRQVARRANPRHYPAPFALIDIWRRHGGNGRAMLRAEAESVAALITGSTARSLVHVFFLRERLRGSGKEGRDKEMEEAPRPRRVHVIGAGTMGADIAAWCVLQGLAVSVQDTRPEAIATALRRAEGLLKRRLREPRRVQNAFDHLIPDEHGAGVGRADVVIEAIVEKADAKQALFADVERRAAPEALLATNTSSIPLETIAEALQSRERLVGLHFFNPVRRMPLVEVVAGQSSGRTALARARAFATQIDRLPLPVKSAPGFLVNRVLTPYLLEAVVLHTEGIAIERIDGAATDFGMPMGPILLADTVGLDVCLSVAEVLAETLDVSVPDRLRELVAAGHLGAKSGHGFYRHQAKKRPQPVDDGGGSADLGAVQDRLVLRLLNEAVACLREGVVADADLLDAGMVFGTGFAPFRGGPMHYARSEGVEAVVERLHRLAERHGARFQPDPGWEQLK